MILFYFYSRCRPHLSGRTCSLPEQNYFVGTIDVLTSEAELSNCTKVCIKRKKNIENYWFTPIKFCIHILYIKRGWNFQNCQVYIREPYRDGRNNTWTGTGFMKVFDDAELVFDIKNIPTTTNYDIVLRYEPQVSCILI